MRRTVIVFLGLRFKGLMALLTEVVKPIYWVDFGRPRTGDKCGSDALAGSEERGD